jgi:DNA-directed RNA polymerase subunit beta'
MSTPQLDKVFHEKGGDFIRKELNKIDLDKKEKEILERMKTKTGEGLQNEVKQIKYIRALKAQDLKPGDAYVISKVPVLPPVFRPVLPGRGGQEIIYGDINPLYRDLLYVNNQFKEVKESNLIPGEEKKLRPVLDQAVGAVYGVNDPVTAKSKARGHKGFLTYISGTTSPKEGYFQSKLMRRTQDMAGRGTIVPDNTLGMDEVGIPTDMLWTMYEKVLVSNLVRKGHNALEAEKFVKERHPVAQTEMQKELLERPVIINRAPTLHRYNMVAAYPRMVAGKTIRVNPFIEVGSNSDYDGDTMQVHVPLGPKAVDEAKGMTLSNLLYSDKSKNDLLVFPQHEAIMGLAQASGVDEKNPPKSFKTEAEAMKAYKEGKITLGTRVKIG